MTIGRIKKTVNMADVDLVQVYYARFFVWLGESYEALFRELGHPLSAVIGGGCAIPVVDVRCEYFRPVGLDDEFEVSSAVVSTGRTSFTVLHRFEDESGLFAVGRSTHVWIEIHPTQTPKPVPQWLLGAVERDFGADIPTPRSR